MVSKIAVLTLSLFCLPLWGGQDGAVAQKRLHLDSLESKQDRRYDLSEVVVTGTRTPKTLMDVPVLTYVISSKDIQRTDATNIQDLLQTEMPGVEFSYAMNQQVNMNMSGLSGQSMLILVDGERLAGETMDNVDFTRLSMTDVERIEIVRGAASALYGSNAAGGVINIITRKAKEPWSVHVDGRWGEHNQQRYNGALGFSKGDFFNNLTFSSTSSDNYEVKNRGTEPQTITFTEVYGDKTISISDRMRFDLSLRPTPRQADSEQVKNFHLSGKLSYFRRSLDRVVDSQERYHDYQAGMKAEWQMTDKDYLEASYNFDQYDKSDYLRTRRLDVRKYSNVQNSFRMLYNHTFRQADILTIGADYLYDYLMNTNLDEGAHHQQSFDVFSQYDWRINSKWELLGALRYDYFSDGGMSRVTPKLSARWSPIRRLTLRASYGMGFRAPTLKEKYYNFDMAGIWIVEGNASLTSELSHNFTLGAEYIRGAYSFTMTGNVNRIKDKITTGLPYHKDATGQWYLAYINLGSMNVYSLEASANARLQHGFSAKASYVFTHEALPEVSNQGAKSGANQYMPARRHSLTLRGEWDHQFSKSFGLDVVLSGRALSSATHEEYYSLGDPDQGTHEVRYPAYSLWKLQLTGRVKDWIRVTFTVDNLFNYRPEYYYYNAPLTQGINFLGGISIDINKK